MIRYMRKIWRQGSKPGVFPRLLEQNPDLITQISRACYRFYLPCSTNCSRCIILISTSRTRYLGVFKVWQVVQRFLPGIFSVLLSVLSLLSSWASALRRNQPQQWLGLCPNVGYIIATLIFSLSQSSAASRAARLRGFRQSH